MAKSLQGNRQQEGCAHIRVFEQKFDIPIRNAYLTLETGHGEGRQLRHGFTDEQGMVPFNCLPAGIYEVWYHNVRPDQFKESLRLGDVEIGNGTWQQEQRYAVAIPLMLKLTFESQNGDRLPHEVIVGDVVRAEVLESAAGTTNVAVQPSGFFYEPVFPLVGGEDGAQPFRSRVRYPGQQQASVIIKMEVTEEARGTARDGRVVPGLASMVLSRTFDAMDKEATPITGNIGVSLSRTETEATPDLALWVLIRNSTDALGFNNYHAFLDHLFCHRNTQVPPGFEGARFGTKAQAFQRLRQTRALPFTDSESYRLLKAATEAFVMVNCGVLHPPLAFNQDEDEDYLDRRDIPAVESFENELRTRYLESLDEENRILPYLSVIRRKLSDIDFHTRHDHTEADLCFGLIQERLANPCLVELIWSYWHEEGMLAQTMNAVTRRFQNQRSPGPGLDPLANMEIDMLRPLNNLLWGYTQDEQHRLTVVRRNYEYDHHYGIRLDGKAVRDFRPADSRSKFLESFHQLLRMLTLFYRQDDDTTVKADAFPILNALKEVHLVLSEGAHNQYGDLPSTARIEMLMQQWMLARPEFREFLPTRTMVAYPEPWMDRVDAMKKLQGWSDTSIVHFRNLAIFGEQLLLSIRFGHWSDVVEPTQAFNWARFWRPQAQGYIHAYRAATGADLSAEVVAPGTEATLPSRLLRQRLEEQQRRA